MPAPSQKRSFRVGLVQMAMSSDLDENLRAAVSKVEQAAKKGAQVVCLPELYRSPYFCQREDAGLFDLAEPVPAPAPAPSPRWPSAPGWRWWCRSSSAGPPASITTASR